LKNPTSLFNDIKKSGVFQYYLYNRHFICAFEDVYKVRHVQIIPPHRPSRVGTRSVSSSHAEKGPQALILSLAFARDLLTIYLYISAEGPDGRREEGLSLLNKIRTFYQTNPDE